MKPRVLETLALLLLAGILWGMAAWVVRLEKADKTTTHAEAMRIQGRVQTALRLAGKEADRALERVRRSPRAPFAVPLPREGAPCFVFYHDSLVYWSDHSLTNEFDLPPEPYSYRSADTHRGKLVLVVRGYGGSGYRAAACVLLESKYGITNRYLAEEPNPAIFGTMTPRLVIDEKARLPQIRAVDGTYLFSLAPDPTAVPVGESSWLPLGLLVAGAIVFALAWLRLALPLWQHRQHFVAILVLLVPLALFRAALLYLNLPFAVADLALFDPKYYAASWLAPSLGDQLLNALLLSLLAVMVMAWYRRAHVGRSLSRRLSGLRRELLALGCLAVLALLLAYRYRVYQDTFDNSQLDLDVSQTVSLNWLKLLLAVLVVLHSAVAGVGLYLLTSLGNRLVPARLRNRVWRMLLAGEILLWVGAFWLSSHGLALGALTLLFAKGVLVISERQRIRGVSYPQTVFLIAAVALWALIGALAQKRHHDRQLHAAEQKLAAGLLVEHDVLSEFLLEEVAGKIANDPLVERALKSTFPQPDIARKKIEKVYLRDYFTQYETSVRFFDGTGREFGAEKLDTTRGLDQLRRRLLRTARPTEHAGLYLLSNNIRSLTERRYIKLVRLPDVAGSAAAPPTIALELVLKKLSPYGGVPELLIDQKYAPTAGPLAVRSLSYAVFDRKGLIASEGDYDYSDWRVGAKLFKEPQFYRAGLEYDGAHHLAVRADKNTTLVLSTPAYTAGDVLSNFSFLFLLHLIAGMGTVTVVLLVNGRQQTERRLRASLSTKIQVLLNLGTLIPLLVVSGATAAVSSAAYQRDLVATYQQRGVRVQQNLIRAGRFLQARDAGREPLNDLLKDVADLSETDILLYDPVGRLLTASQPLLYETDVLSRLLNPEAMASLRERGQPRTLTNERAGELDFNALYLPLPNTSPEGGPRVLGYIGIPFFDSAKALDLKLTELLTTMMNIFTVMFIVFLLIAFLASRRLTAPLKLLAEKLKQTTLTGQNEQLDYQTPDEIGLLVSEYNQMLTKLEDSRRELATRAQEAAWREMARQVAHEIKNPLTPMKLSLQYLQRVIHDGRDNVEALIDKVSKTLITQIDTLSDIASSFSSFIALPEPKPERLELMALLRHCLDLHSGTANKPVQTELREAWVIADKSLLVRTFNNLLLNALQAIPSGREPRVRASVALEGATICVGIHDNGIGIPAEVQPKVFVPNFSTKFSGSGIGLAVAKRAVEGAGGQLWFETRENEGTTFYLTLPNADSPD